MATTESPKTTERLTWVIFAALAWKFSLLGESRGVGAESALALAFTVAGTALGLGALVVALTDRAGSWLRSRRVILLFAFFVVGFALIDVIERARFVYRYTTDADVFTDYAARLLLAGKNPYDTSLYGAMVAHRVPIELQTPLADGGFSDRLAYPSLSFLTLVPFVALGLPTTLVYGLALCGCLVLLFERASVELRPLVLVPFFIDTTYLAYSFGGITDPIWAIFLCLTVVAWKRPAVAALLVGLACSYKQHAWLLVPFLLVRVVKEARPERRWDAVLRFGAIVAGTFLVTQLPFFLWNPRAWSAGVLEPLVANMVPLGQGFSAFVPQAGLPIPKAAFAIAFWGSYVALLVVSASWSAGFVLVWIGPSLAFLLNYRSFTSYWCFNALPLVLELCRVSLPRSTFVWPFRIRGRVVAVVLAGVLTVSVAALTARARAANAAVEVTLTAPLRTWAGNVKRIDLRVENRGLRDIEPRFWVQGTGFQPLSWRIDAGPRLLGPGQSAAYSISAVHTVSEFDVALGGNLTMTDLLSPVRKRLRIEPDVAALSPLDVPNASFEFWDMSVGSPTFWKTQQDRSPGAHVTWESNARRRAVRLHLEPDARVAARSAFAFCPALPSCYAMAGAIGRFAAEDLAPGDEHRVALSTDFAARPEPVSVWAFPPASANRAPEWAERYGVQLTFGRKRVFLFLGGEAATGTLADGTPFEVRPGPREQWTRYTIDFGALQTRYAKDAYPQARTPLPRFLLLELPVVPVGFALTYASKADGPKSALFGEIEDTLRGRDRAASVLAQLRQHPGQVDAWRAAYEADLGNVSRAKEHLRRARSLEAHPQLELQAAHLALMAGDIEEARASFTRALDFEPMQAHVGLGWSLVALHRLPEAREHFTEALREVAKAAEKRKGDGVVEVHQLIATVGLATVQAAEGNCAAAHQTLDNLPPAERAIREQDIVELAACQDR